MKRMSKVLCATGVLVALSAPAAMAAEKNPAIFATDVLGAGFSAVSMRYDFSSADMDKKVSDGVTTDRYKYKIREQVGALRADVGLGFGLQLGVQQRFMLDGEEKGYYNGAYAGKFDYSGALNPEFELKWNPMQALSPKNPLQAVIGYRVKPTGMAKSEVMDNYTENTVFAAASYDLKQYNLRPYLKYSLQLNGTEEDGGSLGNQNVMTLGAEYKIMDGLKADLAYTYARNAAIGEYDGGFSSNSISASVQYKIPGVPYMDLYAVPYGQVSFNGSRDSEAPAGWTDKVESFTSYRVGGMIKAVF